MPSPAQFTILIDTAEQHAYSFMGLRADADRDYEPIAVNVDYTCLGRHPDSLGDYSLVGGIGRCHIERKSMDDAHSTILGFAGDRRQRFENELANLSRIEAPLVLVECSLESLLVHAPQWGKKTQQQNAKTLFRSILAYQQDYRVPWMFAGSRLLAEQSAYWFLRRFWAKHVLTHSTTHGENSNVMGN